MGTVHLTNGHHGLFIREVEADLGRRVILDAALLARPILHSIYEGPAGDSLQAMTRAALRALMGLKGLNAAVSYQVINCDGVPHIAMPKRVWGEITILGPHDVVLGFSHDTRFSNYSFVSLQQWLEEHQPPRDVSDEEYDRFLKSWTSVEKWASFFEDRLRRKARSLRGDMRRLQQEAVQRECSARAIERAIGH